MSERPKCAEKKKRTRSPEQPTATSGELACTPEGGVLCFPSIRYSRVFHLGGLEASIRPPLRVANRCMCKVTAADCGGECEAPLAPLWIQHNARDN